MLIRTNHATPRLFSVVGNAQFTISRHELNVDLGDGNGGQVYQADTHQGSSQRSDADIKTEMLLVFDYIQWCIEGEETVAASRPFLCDLSGTIPSKPFTFGSASSGDDV